MSAGIFSSAVVNWFDAQTKSSGWFDKDLLETTSATITLEVPLLSGSSSFYSPIISVGEIVLQTSSFLNTNEFFTSEVSPGGVTLEGALLENTNSFFGGTLTNIIVIGYRVLENGTDLRIDESANVRTPENFTASGNGISFVGAGSVQVFPRATFKSGVYFTGEGAFIGLGRKHSSISYSLQGVGEITGTPAIIPFASIVYVNRSGVWKEAVIHVNRNNGWTSSARNSYKVAGNWKRVY